MKQDQLNKESFEQSASSRIVYMVMKVKWDVIIFITNVFLSFIFQNKNRKLEI